MKTSPLAQGIWNLLFVGLISAVAVVAQTVMIAGYLTFRVCHSDPGEAYALAAAGMLPVPAAVLVTALWIGIANVVVVYLLAKLWLRRRADVLHNRGVELIDKRKDR
jgi:hypothetical protein